MAVIRKIDLFGEEYDLEATLPIASKTNLGCVIVGNGLIIDANGVLSATGGGTSSGGYGFYSMEVDEDGNLWAVYADDGLPPPFEYDSETGNLYYNLEGV